MSTNIRAKRLGSISLTVVFALNAGLMTACTGSDSGKKASDDFKYVSECDLDNGDSVTINDDWMIRRSKKKSPDFLYAQDLTHDVTEIEYYVSYMVFDSSKDAETKIEMISSDENVKICDEGECWIETREQYDDAAAVYFYYLEDNVIIVATLDFIDQGSELPPDETPAETTAETTATGGKKDRCPDAAEIREYVITNAAELVDSLLNDVLLDECSLLY